MTWTSLRFTPHQIRPNILDIISTSKIKKYAEAFARFGIIGGIVGISVSRKGVMSQRKDEGFAPSMGFRKSIT